MWILYLRYTCYLNILLFRPIEQSLFSLQFADFCNFLRNFYYSFVISKFVANSKVLDQNKFSFHPDPKACLVFFSGSESFYDLLYHMDAFVRVTVFYVAADYRIGSPENPFFRSGVEFSPYYFHLHK